MRFKDFLYEAKHRQDISVEKAIELLKANCKDALKFKDQPIIRGTKSREDAYLVQGELGSRSSAHSDSNQYTVILDEVMPAEWPRRSASIIAGNSKNDKWVEQYGTVYALFPYDGVKIGVCPVQDIFGVQMTIGNSKRERGLNDWNEFFTHYGIPDYSFEDLIDGIFSAMQDDEDEKLADTFNDIFDNPEEDIKKAYSPSNLGLKLATTADFAKYNDRPREVWIGGKCIAIRYDVWEDIEDQL